MFAVWPGVKDFPELRVLPREDAKKVLAEAYTALQHQQGLAFAKGGRGRLSFGDMAWIIACIVICYVMIAFSISHFWLWLTFPFVAYFAFKPKRKREVYPHVLAALDKYQGALAQRRITHEGRPITDRRPHEASR